MNLLQPLIDGFLAGINVVLSLFIGLIITGIMKVLGVFFFVAATFTQVMLQLNLEVVTNPLVQYGWSIVRDFANLGFVLVILVIAFATILRFEGYGMKQLLWKLVIAAVLVNFSLMIAGFFVDFTNFLAQTFFSGGTNKFISDISGSIGIQSVLNPSKIPFNAPVDTTGASTVMDVAMNGLFVIFFTMVGIVVVATIGFMLLVRYVHLVFLLIIAPLAWLFWTFPDLSGMARRWWSSLLRWCFFAPAALFFLYLSTEMAKYLAAKQSIQGILAASQAAAAGGTLSLIPNLLQAFSNMFIVGAMMVGSLIIGNEFGVAGANMGIKYAKMVSTGVLGAAGAKAGRFARRRVVAPSAQKASDLAAAASGKGGNFARFTGIQAGLRGAATGFGRIAGSGKEAQKKEAEEFKKGFANLSYKALGEMELKGSPAKIAALAATKAEKGLAISTQQSATANRQEVEKALEHAEKVDMEDSILRRHPDMVGRVAKYKPSPAEADQGITAEQKYAGKLRAADVDKWDANTLGSLTHPNNTALLEGIVATNRALLGPIADRLNASQMDTIKVKLEGDIRAGKAPSASATDQKKGRDAESAIEFMKKNFSWAPVFPQQQGGQATASRPLVVGVDRWGNEQPPSPAPAPAPASPPLQQPPPAQPPQEPQPPRPPYPH
jgi:hypothetical protein